jgi:hypothetical protein
MAITLAVSPYAVEGFARRILKCAGRLMRSPRAFVANGLSEKRPNSFDRFKAAFVLLELRRHERCQLISALATQFDCSTEQENHKRKIRTCLSGIRQTWRVLHKNRCCPVRASGPDDNSPALHCWDEQENGLIVCKADG